MLNNIDYSALIDKLQGIGKYKPNSIKTFINSIKKINETVFGKSFINLEDYEDFEKVLSFIFKQKMNNRKIYAYAINLMMKTLNASPRLIKIYLKIFNTISRDVDNKKIYQEPTEREKELYRSWNDILKLRMDLGKKFNADKVFKNLYNYYILSLFTFIPPLRPQELCSCLILPQIVPNANFNYYSIKENELHINNFKTEKSFGERIIKVPPKLTLLIKKIGSKYLVPTINKIKQQTPTSLCMYFKRVLGFNPSILRKIYISHIIDKEIDPEEKKRIAYIMGHSPATQVLIYSKFSNSIHKK